MSAIMPCCVLNEHLCYQLYLSFFQRSLHVIFLRLHMLLEFLQFVDRLPSFPELLCQVRDLFCVFARKNELQRGSEIIYFKSCFSEEKCFRLRCRFLFSLFIVSR